MFKGSTSLSLDAKGRFAVPTKHRDALSADAGNLVITKHPNGCLMVFPIPGWEEFQRQFASMPLEAHGWKRFFLGNANDVEMDSAGRVLVPPMLRNWAEITKDAVLVGMGSYFELWDAQRHVAQEADVTKSQMPDVFKNISF